jgi:hypothetical protein
MQDGLSSTANMLLTLDSRRSGEHICRRAYHAHVRNELVCHTLKEKCLASCMRSMLGDRRPELGVGYTKYVMEFVEVKFYGIGLKETRPYLKPGEMMIYRLLGTISMGEGIRRLCKAIH